MGVENLNIGYFSIIINYFYILTVNQGHDDKQDKHWQEINGAQFLIRICGNIE